MFEISQYKNQSLIQNFFFEIIFILCDIDWYKHLKEDISQYDKEATFIRAYVFVIKRSIALISGKIHCFSVITV